MSDFVAYRKSISQELISTKDRVRNFIDDRHWGEDGRYKEIILEDKIKQLLPSGASVGNGFVMCGENITTSQLDIVVYRTDFPLFFKKESFVIIPKESVLGIIEVKTKLNSSNIRETVKKAHLNGQLIGNKIFNGIFSYENGFCFEGQLNTGLKESLENYSRFINNITFGKDYFMKFWKDERSSMNNIFSRYSFYKIDELAFGYFISNLLEVVHCQLKNKELSELMNGYLYPIEGGKESYRLCDFDIEIRREEE